MKVVHEISSVKEGSANTQIIVQEMVFQLSGVPITGGQPYVHNQLQSSDTWVVNHNLGFFPVVDILSPGGIQVVAEIAHISNNQFQVIFNSPQVGTAIAR